MKMSIREIFLQGASKMIDIGFESDTSPWLYKKTTIMIMK